jgi:hypothetical protein
VYNATSPGTYRARFSRISSAPTASQWNKWSAPITITESTATTAASTLAATGESLIESTDDPLRVDVYPNPATSDAVNVVVNTSVELPVEIQVLDLMGSTKFEQSLSNDESGNGLAITLPSNLSTGMYVVLVRQGNRIVKRKVLVRN